MNTLQSGAPLVDLSSISNAQLVSTLLGAGLGAGFATAFLITFAVFFLFAIVTMVIPMCLIFKKAGRAWWEALIPFYNVYVLTVITGQPWWILLGIFIPLLNWIVGIYLYYHLSKRFGFDIPFTIGLIFLPFVFLPILGFGKALYTAPEVILESSPKE